MRWLLAASLVLCVATPAWGGGEDSVGRPSSLQSGLGFMADPEAFLVGIEADFLVHDQLSVGPMVQFGLDDDFTVISPTAYARLWFDLPGHGEALRRVRPFIQAGAGFAYIEIDAANLPGVAVDDDDIGFLTNAGFGADFRLSHSFSIGTKLLFNMIPGEVFGESFYFSWEVAALRYRF